MEIGLSLAARLGELALKNSASVINSKIALAKASKDQEKTIQELEEIVNELIEEKQELYRIATSYQSELERVVISENDLNHLHRTVENIVDTFSYSINEEQTKLLLSFLSVDTLKTMQLLGFNYKQAIGDPLTEALAGFIREKLKVDKPPSNTNSRNNSGKRK